MKNQDNKLQEIQILEHNLQQILMQKQVFQMELEETSSSLKEIDNSGGEVFKIIGQLMIKADKSKIKEELSNKEKLIKLRMKNFEKQEDFFSEKLEELRKSLLGK